MGHQKGTRSNDGRNCSLSVSDSLEGLHGENMRELLKCIWDAERISEPKFLNLRVLAVLDCTVLTKIFT